MIITYYLINLFIECPADIKEAVCSLIWCSNKVPIAELTEVRKQLIKKYGKEFAKNADANHESCVNQRLFEKLMVKPPSSVLGNYFKLII